MTSHDQTARLVRQVQAGDEKARADLLAHAIGRLEELAHQMLKGFPVVRRYKETGDIQNSAWLRLSKALDQVQLQSVSHYYHLAALQIRRELLDLARHYSGPEGEAANHQTDSHDPENGFLARQPAPAREPSFLAELQELHEAVENLPEDEREVIDLIFYQGLTQVEAATHLRVDERTVRRRWVAASHRLGEKFRQ